MQKFRGSKSRFGRPSKFNFKNKFGRPNFQSRFNRNSRSKNGEYIDVNKFIRKSSDMVEQKPVIINSFNDFGLAEIIVANLRKKNYQIPTLVQDKSIKHIMEGRDLVGLANTGTGKTAAFLLPLIDKIHKNRNQRVLIIAPTRELALQINSEFLNFSWGMKIFSTVCIGGSRMGEQIRSLRSRPNFVIGTPGRLKDLGNRRIIDFLSFNNIVIDEIDRMLDMGFVDDIKNIIGQLPQNRQSLVFSATIPEKIRILINQFLRNPIMVEAKTADTSKNVDQDVVRINDKSKKFDKLKDLLVQEEFKKVLIFNKTKHEVEKLALDLIQFGFKAESIHGDKRQNQRQRALYNFKTNHANILVATDVAARGLDIKDITHVINYSIPQSYNDYIHRIGRTGRGDCKGKALTFV
jgi:superfamily II DNA/RNA helicase